MILLFVLLLIPGLTAVFWLLMEYEASKPWRLDERNDHEVNLREWWR